MNFELINFYTGLMQGPHGLQKKGFVNFGDFILMLLILSILNNEWHCLLLPGKLLRESVKNITYFLMAFPILSEIHSKIFLEFKQIYLPILLKNFQLTPQMSSENQKNMRNFLRNLVNQYFEKNFEKPHESFKKYDRFFERLLPILLKTGLQTYISPYNCSKKTTSSVTKMFVVQNIVKTIFDYLTNKLGENFLSKMEDPDFYEFFSKNQGIEMRSIYIAFWMFHKYRENKVFSLYMNTILSTEYLGDQLTVAKYDEIMNCADVAYREIIMNNLQDYEEWISLNNEILRTKLGFYFPIHPKNWKTNPTWMVSWILNTFQNANVVGKFCERMVEKR